MNNKGMEKKMGMMERAREVRAWTLFAVFLAGVGAVGYTGMELARSQMAEDIYRTRLSALSEDYAKLRDQYERALRETVVTELEVKGEALNVRYLRGDGEVVTIPTNLNTEKEIFIDFYVAGNRVGIRRLFDSSLPADSALVLDEPWDTMAKDAPPASFGRTVYRRLDQGRWVVTMTGNGSLGLTRSPHDGRGHLAAPPTLVNPEAPLREGDEAVEEISLGDVVGWLMGKYDEPQS